MFQMSCCFQDKFQFQFQLQFRQRQRQRKRQSSNTNCSFCWLGGLFIGLIIMILQRSHRCVTAFVMTNNKRRMFSVDKRPNIIPLALISNNRHSNSHPYRLFQRTSMFHKMDGSTGGDCQDYKNETTTLPRQHESPTISIRLQLSHRDDVLDLGALLAAVSTTPDAVLLHGDLGAGKTTFAKGFISCKLGMMSADATATVTVTDSQVPLVTSPTYLLSNSYFYREEEESSSSSSSSLEQKHERETKE